MSKGKINTRLGVTKNNYLDLAPQLQKVINDLPKDGKNNRQLLTEGLKKLGWTKKEIKNFLSLESSASLQSKHNPNQKISPSFKFYKPKSGLPEANPKPFQGGSPGLGKNK